jgi:hypothetical protein
MDECRAGSAGETRGMNSDHSTVRRSNNSSRMVDRAARRMYRVVNNPPEKEGGQDLVNH